MFAELIYLLLFLIVALVSGNNLSACSGSIISSRIVSRRTGIWISVLGYIVGFMLEGGLLKAGLFALMPDHISYLIIVALSVSLLVFVVAHAVRVPQSLSMTLAMAIVGIELAYSGFLNVQFLSYIIAFWILSSILSVALTMVSMRASYRLIVNSRIWATVSRIKLLLILISFLTAFVLGANTIGFLFAATSGMIDQTYGILIVIAAIIVGSMLLSKGELKRIGNDILPLRYLNALISQSISVLVVQAATMLSIPASNTQTFTASLYGAGLSYRTRLILKRPMFIIILSWIATAAIGLLMGYAATYLIVHPIAL